MRLPDGTSTTPSGKLTRNTKARASSSNHGLHNQCLHHRHSTTHAGSHCPDSLAEALRTGSVSLQLLTITSHSCSLRLVGLWAPLPKQATPDAAHTSLAGKEIGVSSRIVNCVMN